MEAWLGTSAHAVKYPFFELEKEKIRQGHYSFSSYEAARLAARACSQRYLRRFSFSITVL
jgi:hypothetical protein